MKTNKNAELDNKLNPMHCWAVNLQQPVLSVSLGYFIGNLLAFTIETGATLDCP